MDSVDVAVVGLGAMGALTLWRLASRGVSAAGYDSFDPPHDRGSSHGDSRIIRTAYAEGSFHVPLVQEAWGLWRELEAAGAKPLLTPTGALMIGPAGAELVHGTLASAVEHGLVHERLEPGEVALRWPQHVLGEGDVAIYEPQAGVLRPEACIAAALDQATLRGAAVHPNTRVAAVEAERQGVRVRLEDGSSIEAGACVLAAGPWMPGLAPQLVTSLRVERQVNAWFALDAPAAFAPDRFPVFIRELADGRLRFGIPSLDGATIKLAVHHEGRPADPDDLERNVTAADLAPIREFAETALKGVRPDIVRTIVCMYANTPDELFILGALPGSPGVVVIGGCSGHSFKFAPILGDVVADLVLEGKTHREVAHFSPARLTSLAGGLAT
ncbi:MAG TPA: N-methyl-L-tryptophan oxidase [Candidatus Acidoferrales bacterium]|nr:N-methyl-L-tryptophan oxidase [Candidatus Acidoferrales bacterium]